ncbi:hypothetical protein Kpho02_68770 [Kitasatospora phosalacinea]|uniref:DUF7927 domain-containing protein n=1 Tax=Kitasatospora phosalacinea TaxID=2065 RepID=A0A9W6QEB3_9ACTN|nr:hypothetical protein [Kitasatospora phosalacinea]GLW74579.1 hypothetical protein Kpho02_68770 [Kitasatospora phosalacinea]
MLRALCAVLPVAGLLVPLAAAPAVPAALRGAGTQRPIGPDPAVSLLAHGGLTMAANSVLTCDPSDGSPCNDTEGSNNNRTRYVKSDPNAPGDNASAADLVLPAGAKVLSARLYWQFNSVNTSTAGGHSGDIARGDRVSWKVPGSSSYEQLTADTYDWFDQQTGGTPTLLAGAGVKDVTAQVRAAGPGSYTVADLQACDGRSSSADGGGSNVGCWGGWSLVVAYEDRNAPLRYLDVWDGFQLLRSPDNLATLTLGGIRTPATTAPPATLGVVVGDGDVQIAGDQLLVGSSTADLTLLPLPGPTGVVTDNAFASRIDRVATDGTGSNVTTRDPNPVDNYGYDARTIDVTGRIPAAATQAVLQVNGSGDALHPQAVWLAVDALEPDLQITKANRPAGTTDDDPPGDVEPGDTVTCTLPDLAPGATANLAFDVTVDADATGGTVLDDTATLGFRGSQTRREQTRTSNTVRNTVVDLPRYRVEKTATPSSAAPGGTVAYRVTVTNTGKVPANGVTLDDDLADVLADAAYHGDATADRGTATVTGTTLHWRGDLPVGATATVDYSVTVRSSPTADAELTNTVTSTTYRNNCGRGSTDPACAATVTVTAPGPSPSPSSSPSSPSSSAPTPSGSPGSPGSTASGRLPETGTAGALPLIGLAALGCVLAGLMVLVAKARRKH